ncbi:MAG TPA: DUF4249 domain-containing protein [Chitinophagaceae bacterium]|nr:DUF4249 domain-containing protein [Chitinophagaceae bacterium]HNN30394.1 DUF4249 domain-containing protein [Chitinophagaceae bacterium]
MKRHIIYLVTIVAIITGCRENYTPPEVTTDHKILVVEGFIDVNKDSSYFKLSRTQKLGSISSIKPEAGANISILSSNGTVLTQFKERANGQYVVYGATLLPTEFYRLKITTSGAVVYQSDLIKGKITPAIDSVTWKIDNDKNGIQFYVNSHDAANETKYYKWDCEEVWEYRAYYESQYKYLGDTIIEPRLPGEQIYRCWRTVLPTQIFINTTEKLSSDVISNEKILFVGKGSNRFDQRYSILVKQRALTKEAFEYWQQLKQSSELGGSVFDVQPTQLLGNLHCVTNPNEPIIGYVSATTTAEKRIYILNTNVPTFVQPYPATCEFAVVANNKDSMKVYYTNKRYIPIAPDMQGAYLAGSTQCTDCRVLGGTTIKPAFW